MFIHVSKARQRAGLGHVAVLHADRELLLELGPDLRVPYFRAIGSGLFELRPRGHKAVVLALYCYITGQRVVVLHAFIKKIQSTPQCDLRNVLHQGQRNQIMQLHDLCSYWFVAAYGLFLLLLLLRPCP
ncbi:MAG TPA: type II toxin-antitoxin system RelE/ParE family toxin [Candidatus Latescibacteria bacterium]|nr:type II toxin-antitoxin system RelE/ParE family toxin [Candidatus Handelsmanbacteria bacterium]HIL07954.1 type II toxin-antitoxin system RelE/ParE family toxin [Candidatus Latescibacterota bacterium]